MELLFVVTRFVKSIDIFDSQHDDSDSYVDTYETVLFIVFGKLLRRKFLPRF